MAPNVDIKFTKLFINNEWVDANDGSEWSVVNPSTAEEICKVALAKKADIDAAVASAKAAFKQGSEWRNLDASARGRILLKVADLIERDAEYLATLETFNGGMVNTSTKLSVSNAANTLRYNAGWADKNHGKVVPCDGDFFAYTRHEPVGVCAAIIPWNFPLPIFVGKVAPCLAMGNTIVVKPSEFTPLTALYVTSLFQEAGLPAGVLNVLTGLGAEAGDALSHHMDVDMISFTGSLAVGRLIQKASADSNLKKVALELGGKSPLIVFSDANLDVAVATAHFGMLTHGGQICCAGSRIYVQDDIYEKFLEKSLAMVKGRVVGDPFDAKTAQGPQVNAIQCERILGYLERGVKEGATIKCGGNRVKGMSGYFIEPTIVTDLKDDMEMSKHEVFGPIQQIYKFKDMDEVLERANNTYYGLAAAVVTNDINKYLTVANTVKAGTVWVNCVLNVDRMMPFGGFRQSGIGREGGEYGIHEFTEVKTVIVKQPPGIK